MTRCSDWKADVDPLITLGEVQALMEREKFTISKLGGSWRVRCMVVDRCFQSYALPEAYKKFREWRMARDDEQAGL